MDFKPLNVQFVIETKEQADQLRDLADALGDKLGDRRIRGAAAAKALLEAVLKQPELAAQLLNLDGDDGEVGETNHPLPVRPPNQPMNQDSESQRPSKKRRGKAA